MEESIEHGNSYVKPKLKKKWMKIEISLTHTFKYTCTSLQNSQDFLLLLREYGEKFLNILC